MKYNILSPLSACHYSVEYRHEINACNISLILYTLVDKRTPHERTEVKAIQMHIYIYVHNKFVHLLLLTVYSNILTYYLRNPV